MKSVISVAKRAKIIQDLIAAQSEMIGAQDDLLQSVRAILGALVTKNAVDRYLVARERLEKALNVVKKGDDR